jgi:hypothetical protein
MRDRHADLADLALGERMIGVVAGLGRQIEGDRKAGLALGQIGAIEPVRFRGRRVAGIGAEDPGRVARGIIGSMLAERFAPHGAQYAKITGKIPPARSAGSCGFSGLR